MDQPEDEALARAREGVGDERAVPQPVRAHGEQVAAMAPLEREGPRDADEVEARDEEDERQEGDVLVRIRVRVRLGLGLG